MDRTLAANLAAALAAVSAGASVVATRMAVGEVDPVSVAFLRYAVAAPCMLPFLLGKTRGARLGPRDALAIAMLGGLFFGLFPWAFSAALEHTTAARGSVGLATLPIVTLLLACAFGRERLSGLKGLSAILAFTGVAVAIGPAALTGAVGAQVLFGDGLMMLAVLCGAGYSVFARPYLMRYGPLFVTALAMLFGLALLSPLTWLVSGWSGPPTLTGEGWAAVIFLGTVGGALQFALYTWALKWIAPSRTAIYLTLNPISAMALATVLLGEAITLELLAGFVLVSAGIVLANRPARTEVVETSS
tara:strand:- start:477 stop:1385 length:909 start_codon:yes stop_codon:yes gene_type:complete